MKLMSGARAGYLATLAGGLAIGFAVIGTAAATPHLAGTVTHNYSLAASAFTPDKLASTTHDYFNHWDPATLSNGDINRCFSAGLSLPNGVTLKSVKVHYSTGVAGTIGLVFELNRQNLINHTDTVAAGLILVNSGSGGAYTSATLPIPSNEAAVNYVKYAYSAGVCLVGSTIFSGLTISYTQPAA